MAESPAVLETGACLNVRHTALVEAEQPAVRDGDAMGYSGRDRRASLFRYKDYRRNGRARFRAMTLKPNEFIRRFLLHVLPKGFHRIRHYGLLASATCKANIARTRELIAAPAPSIDPSTEQDDADVAARPGDPHPPEGERQHLASDRQRRHAVQ
jgi:hypothetical protein